MVEHRGNGIRRQLGHGPRRHTDGARVEAGQLETAHADMPAAAATAAESAELAPRSLPASTPSPTSTPPRRRLVLHLPFAASVRTPRGHGSGR